MICILKHQSNVLWKDLVPTFLPIEGKVSKSCISPIWLQSGCWLFLSWCFSNMISSYLTGFKIGGLWSVNELLSTWNVNYFILMTNWSCPTTFSKKDLLVSFKLIYHVSSIVLSLWFGVYRLFKQSEMDDFIGVYTASTIHRKILIDPTNANW